MSPSNEDYSGSIAATEPNPSGEYLPPSGEAIRSNSNGDHGAIGWNSSEDYNSPSDASIRCIPSGPSGTNNGSNSNKDTMLPSGATASENIMLPSGAAIINGRKTFTVLGTNHLRSPYVSDGIY